jgi:[ribosomal protein S18]-alanine N-acetyltransferase
MAARDISRVSLLWATLDNAAELAEHHRVLDPAPWSKESFQGALSHPGATSFVARTGQPLETIGFIIGQLAADEAELQMLGVVPAWQRNGLGHRLVESLARAAAKAEARRLFLEVAEDNLPALALYRKTGFVETGRRKGYYVRSGGTAVDALLMARTLA